jgi:glutaredoxin
MSTNTSIHLGNAPVPNASASPAPVKVFAASNQQCSVASLYRIGLCYAAGLLIFGVSTNWIGLAIWSVAAPLGKFAQIGFFPRFARLTPYGNVSDSLPASVQRTPVNVTFYHALGCPFCPIVLARLQALQKQMGFTLESVDVTLKPQLLAAQGIRSVPVVAVAENRLVGNATSAQLANLIALSQSPVAVN